MALERGTCPKPQNLWLYYFTWQKGSANVIDYLEVGRFSCIFQWSQYNHKGSYKMKTGGSGSVKVMWPQKQRERRWYDNRSRSHNQREIGIWYTVCLKMGGRALSQGMQMTSRSYKRQRKGCIPRASIVQTLLTDFQFLTSRNLRQQI